MSAELEARPVGLEHLVGPSKTPCVDSLIADYMRRYPSERGRYYEEVHQALAPLAREMEWALTALLDEFDRATSNCPSPYEIRKAVSDAARAALTPNG